MEDIDMKIDGIIEDLGYHILNSKDENFLSDIMYAASLSDDELDDKFYDCLVSFLGCCFSSKSIFELDVYGKIIYQRFLILALYRISRGLVSLPDETKEDES